MSTIDTPRTLSDKLAVHGINLTNSQRQWFEKTGWVGKSFLPFRVTEEYLGAALSADAQGRDAILKQIIPDSRELERQDYELTDPLGENKYSPFPRFIHRYPDRVLFLVTDNCAVFCRHCFRRTFSGKKAGRLTVEQIQPMLEYLKEHTEVREALFTGGDPLTLGNSIIDELLAAVKQAKPDLIIRICSRMPVVLPSRITDELAGMLARYEGVWFVTHFNHPAEITAESSAALRRLVQGGIPVLNQTVLLRGVNDDPKTLAKLFNSLLFRGVKPYYLFQGDLAEGTSHLRLPLSRSLEIAAELKRTVSGIAMPRFAVDIPGGGGKITLPPECHEIRRAGKEYIIKGLDNEEYRYPAD